MGRDLNGERSEWGEEQEPHGVAVISYKKHAQILRE